MSDEKLLSFKSNGKCRYVTFLKYLANVRVLLRKKL